MAPFASLAVGFLLTVHTAAHFILQYPPSLGFSDDDEATSPCGGFDVTFNSSDASAQVGGFAVSMLSTHPGADWLFRATLDQKAPFNWTNLLPVVTEVGLGQFCIPNLVAPPSFSGKQGVVQVIQKGPDGTLYQCAAVNFVDGVNSTVGSACTNATGLTATITNQTDFTSTSGTPTASGSSSGASSASSTSAAPQSSHTGAAISLNIPGFWTAVMLSGGFAAARLAF